MKIYIGFIYVVSRFGGKNKKDILGVYVFM